MAKRNGWITIKSIVSVVAIIVLATLIIWGLYVVRERGEVARREEAVKLAQERLDEIARQEVKDPDSNTNNQNSEPETAVNEGGSSQQVNEGGSSELPQTGPSDAISIVSLALVIFAVTSYAYSARHLRVLQSTSR